MSLDFYFSEHLSFKTKINYDPKGYGGLTFIHLDYLTLAPLANIHFGKFKSFNIHVGPYFGQRLTSDDGPMSVFIDLFNDYNEFDYGINIGFGLKLLLAEQLFYFEIDG
jgi:hypothetical protein